MVNITRMVTLSFTGRMFRRYCVCLVWSFSAVCIEARLVWGTLHALRYRAAERVAWDGIDGQDSGDLFCSWLESVFGRTCVIYTDQPYCCLLPHLETRVRVLTGFRRFQFLFSSKEFFI